MNRRTKLGRGETQNGPPYQGARELHSNLASGDRSGALPVPTPHRGAGGLEGSRYLRGSRSGWGGLEATGANGDSHPLEAVFLKLLRACAPQGMPCKRPLLK